MSIVNLSDSFDTKLSFNSLILLQFEKHRFDNDFQNDNDLLLFMPQGLLSSCLEVIAVRDYVLKCQEMYVR